MYSKTARKIHILYLYIVKIPLFLYTKNDMIEKRLFLFCTHSHYTSYHRMIPTEPILHNYKKTYEYCRFFEKTALFFNR